MPELSRLARYRAALSHALFSSEPSRIVLRGVALFYAADVFFTGFAAALAFKSFSVPGVLAFIAVQQLFSCAGYARLFYAIRKRPLRPLQLQRLGVMGMFASMVVASVCPATTIALCVLAAGGGFFRGTAWASRTWMELQHTRGAGREQYLALSETAATLTKLLGPGLGAVGLWLLADNLQVFFGIVGVLGCSTAYVLRKAALETPVPDEVRPLTAGRSPDFWKTAPFYVLDGFGHALRNVLFVSGVMAVVGSAAAYGAVEAAASLVAAAFLSWKARNPGSAPNLRQLRWSLTLLAAGWVCLLGALRLPWLLPLFVGAYALGNPLVSAVKNGLTLKGIAQTEAAPQDAAVARIALMLAARLVALGLGSLLAAQTNGPAAAVTALVGLTLLLLPLEYLCARRLGRQ